MVNNTATEFVQAVMALEHVPMVQRRHRITSILEVIEGLDSQRCDDWLAAMLTPDIANYYSPELMADLVETFRLRIQELHKQAYGTRSKHEHAYLYQLRTGVLMDRPVTMEVMKHVLEYVRARALALTS